MLKSFICTVVWGLGLILHPFHMSVCDIEHNAENKSLEIAQRIFIDDLEVGLKKFHNLESVETYKPKDPQKLDSLISAYILSKLSIVVDNKEMILNYLGSEIEGEARWCYIEVEGVEAVKSVEVTNLILLESFDDQENIVHVKANDKLKSYRLNRDEKHTTFNW